MKNEFSLLDDAEMEKILFDLMKILLQESGRGAILVGSAYVESFLEKFIIDTLPDSLNKKHRNKLFNYPGPLSSFSAKIELSYVFRLINKNLYDSLNYLRRMRNEAAHSYNEIILTEIIQKIDNIFDFGPSFPNYIRDAAMRLLVNYKVDGLKKIIDDSGLANQDKDEMLRSALLSSETEKVLNEQLPFWQLVIGLTFICRIIKLEKEEILLHLDNSNTWGELLNDKK